MTVGALRSLGDIAFRSARDRFESAGDFGFDAVESSPDAADVIECSAQFVGTSGAEVDAAEPFQYLGGVDDFHTYNRTKRGMTLCLG